MKKIFKYFGALLTMALTFGLTGCDVKEDLETAEVGLHIKVFFPTKVVAGQQMTINGSGFAEATSVVFPGDVEVTNFQIVSDEMIRVAAPKGIAAEGGNIVVRTAEDEAESPLPLTLGNTVVSGYSKQAGEAVQGGQQITIFGTDLEFVTAVELLDEEGNPLKVKDSSFNRKGTSNIIFTVPNNIFTGTFAGKVITVDGKTFTMPEIAYEPAPTGYWETVKKVLWKNDGSNGMISWSSIYRFGPDGGDEEGSCLTTFAPEIWNDIIKDGTFYIKGNIDPSADYLNVQITTGWWSINWKDTVLSGGDERLVDVGDGNFELEVSLVGDPLRELIDDQHLLFTGHGYTPLELYVYEQVWVDLNTEGPKEVVIWESDGSKGDVGWGGVYRFGLDGNDSLGECIHTMPAEQWDVIKNGTFYMTAIGSDWVQIRLTTGWWSTTWTGADITTGNELLVDNGDGTFTIEINLDGDPLKDLIDQQHLLFTGGGYTPIKLYYIE